MEFLISQWSIESHTFTAAWGKSCPTLEDVVALNGLLVFWQAKTIRLFEDPEEVVPDEADKKKLEALKNAFSNSKSSSKSMYALQARHFIFGWKQGMTSSLRLCYHTGSHGMSYRAALKMALTLRCFLSNQNGQMKTIGPRVYIPWFALLQVG